MKVWKLIAGILSAVFVLIVILQSCGAGIINTILDTGDSGGTAGLFVAAFMLAGGIVSIATRNVEGNGGNIALISIFGVAFLVGIFNAVVYGDLAVWAWWCLINVIVATANLVYRSRFEKAYIRSVAETGKMLPGLPGADIQNWYYQYGNQWYGPITWSDVPQIEKLGYLNLNTPVYCEGAQYAVYLKDSALRGFVRAYHKPDPSASGIVVPTILWPMAVLVLGILISIGAGKMRESSLADLSKAGLTTDAETSAVAPAERSSAQEMQERMANVSSRLDMIFEKTGIEDTTKSGGEPDGNSSDEENLSDTSIQDTIDELEAVGSVEVDKGIFDVTLTIPAEHAEGVTQENLDKKKEEKGYKEATLNPDGSVTYVMTKAQHKEMMDTMTDFIEESLSDTLASGNYPNYTEINHNSDFTVFTVMTTSTEKPNLAESLSVLALYTYGALFNIYNGTPADNVHVDFVNVDTGEVLASSNANEMGEESGS